jgi:hypothetical protein
MPSKKQQRRRQKLKRHEYEEVYVDEEGRELAPEEAEELIAARPVKNAKAAKAKPAQRGGRVIEPPTWRRTARRGLLFFPLMLVTVFVVSGDQVTTVAKVLQTVLLMAFFLPFSYFMDSMMWRSYQRKLTRTDETKKR